MRVSSVRSVGLTERRDGMNGEDKTDNGPEMKAAAGDRIHYFFK